MSRPTRSLPQLLQSLVVCAGTVALLGACQASVSTQTPDAGDGKPAVSEPADDPVAAPDEPAPAKDAQVDGELATPKPEDGPAAEDKGPKTTKVAAPGAVTCEDGKRKSGERWAVECNECWCTDGGEVMCTRKACK